MNSNVNENIIGNDLLEDTPSDDNSLTDIDDFDDHDYFPSQKGSIEIIVNSSFNENEEQF